MTYVIRVIDKRTKSVSKEDTTRMMLRSATSRYGMKRTTSGRAKVKIRAAHAVAAELQMLGDGKRCLN